LTGHSLGEEGGQERVQLTVDELPSHAHIARACSTRGNRRNPEGAVCARSPRRLRHYSLEPDVDMHDETIQASGGDQAHDNMPPYVGVNFIIALVGIYPSRT
jgi:microcystin-dependent protein